LRGALSTQTDVIAGLDPAFIIVERWMRGSSPRMTTTQI
jgi:hypothetical protein